MRLTKINLRNFRGFANCDQPVDLGHDVVLFYGRNASGKTSIFDALELLLTGSIRRLQQTKDLSSILVNARNPDVAALATLELLDSNGVRFARAKIEKWRAPSVSCALGRAEKDLFVHTAYLQQSDLRRLVTSGAAGLGEVIRAIALDEDVFKLEQALEEAAITRLARPYVAATRRIEALAEEAAQIEKRVSILHSNIDGAESVLRGKDEWFEKVHRIAGTLEIGINLGEHENVDDLLQKLDSESQRRLSSAIEKRMTAEQSLRECEALVERRKGIGNFSENINDLKANKQRVEDALAQCTARIDTLRQELSRDEFAAPESERRIGLTLALEQILLLPNLNACPVCDQQFANLNQHISDKLLGLRREHSNVEQSISKLQLELNDRLTESRRLAREIADFDLAIGNLKADASSFESDVNRLTNRIQPDSTGPVSMDQMVAIFSGRVHSALAESTELTTLASDLRHLRSSVNANALRRGDLKAEFALANHQLEEINMKLVRARSAHGNLDAFVSGAQEARRSLSLGIDRVLQEFVMGKTRETFEELFRRLARNPFFQVTVSDVRVKRHRPEVDWCAVYEKRRFSGEGVFSQGELNSCAIAFFLALATSHKGGLKLLLLDDPVQNMDEIHIEEFGNVLKFLKDRLGWQIVIGLHDQSVYQYLRRQLYPSVEGQSLVNYVFEEGKDGALVVQDGLLEFNRSALIAEVA